MIEYAGFRQLTPSVRRRLLWGIEEYIRGDDGKSVDIVIGALKIIRLGPV